MFVASAESLAPFPTPLPLPPQSPCQAVAESLEKRKGTNGWQGGGDSNGRGEAAARHEGKSRKKRKERCAQQLSGGRLACPAAQRVRGAPTASSPAQGRGCVSACGNEGRVFRGLVCVCVYVTSNKESRLPSQPLTALREGEKAT